MPKDINKYFFNRVKEINMINTQLSTIKFDIPPQLLITGYHGVGKTFLIKRCFNEEFDFWFTGIYKATKVQHLTQFQNVLRRLVDRVGVDR